MPAGKAASQAGHAFLDSFLAAPDHVRAAYLDDGHGTKIVLSAWSEADLRIAHSDALALGLPCALVVDSGHVMPPRFDGSPIVTALGIGPVVRAGACSLTNRFALMT